MKTYFGQKENVLRNMLVYVLLISIVITMLRPLSLYAAEKNYNVDCKAYEFSKGDYPFSSSEPVEVMSFGSKSLGSFEISGDMSEPDEFNGVPAFGVESGRLKFSYKYEGTFNNSEGDVILVEDKGKKVDNLKLDARIDKGVLIVQKSDDGKEWEDAVNPITNIFHENKNPLLLVNFYTTDGKDIAKGTFYRVIIAYETQEKKGSYGVFGFNTGIDKKVNTKHAEVYTFYACKNAGDISIHNLSLTHNDLKQYKTEDVSIDAVQHGETLTDGATTLKGFSIDKLGSSYAVSVNGKAAEDGEEFTEPGKYNITTMTKLGRVFTNTIYVFDGGDDQGFSTYFEESLVQGKRVFRDGEYPTYSAGSFVKIQKISEQVPAIIGTITNTSTGEVVSVTGETREEQVYDLTEGEYYVELFNGLQTSGSMYRYEFHFSVIGEDAKPYVNFNNLMNSENRLSDLVSKHYEVVYQTTGGGYIDVCFSSYSEAFKYAYDIERRYVEKKDDGIYYKLPGNPNDKHRYKTDTDEDKIALTQAINQYARQNIKVKYFNPLSEFTYETINDDDLLANLEAVSIPESRKVCPSGDAKGSLLARVPYLNGFQFIQVEDYDVVKVEALCQSTGKVYPIEFQIPVDEQLEVSSFYKITETNVFGDKFSYDACFMNKNKTVSTWFIDYQGNTTEFTISSETGKDEEVEIIADTMMLKRIQNDLDEQAIVTISAPDVYDIKYELTCLISELDHIALYRAGDYTITFIDRVGNNYSVLVHITGNTSFEQAITGDAVSYTDLYNSIYLNDMPDAEER